MWTLPIQAWRSDDAGRSFTMMTTPHSDNHDLWIDPRDPLRMIEGNDGGACVSFDGGDTWSTIYNQPTAQFYHAAVDTRRPYRVYGTQQDNSAISTPSSSPKGAIPFSDSYAVGAVGERVYRGAPGQPGHRLLGRNRQRPGRRGRAAQVQPRHGRVADHHGVAGDVVRAGRAGHALPLPVDLPDSHIASRPKRALRCREQGLPLHRRGHDVGGGVAGPDARRPGQGRARRRPHQPRRVRRGGLLHHILLRRVAAYPRRILGGLRRRPRPRLPRRRRDVGRHHAAGPPGVGDGQHDRAFAPRPRHGLARGVELQARRLLAVPVPDARRRADLGVDSGGDTRRGARARRPGGPGAGRPAVRGHGDGRLRVAGRGLVVAVPPTEPARDADPRPAGQGRRPCGRDPWQVVLDTRRRDSAQGADGGGDERRRPPLRAAPGRPGAENARQDRAGADRAGQELLGRHRRSGDLRGGRDDGGRHGAPFPGRGPQPARGGDDHLPPADGLAGRRVHHVPGRGG